MADRLTAAELDKMQKSVSDMTDLSRNLRTEFTKIKNTTDLLSDNFKKIVTDANTNLNIAEKYLIAKKTSNALSEKINELKSKSSYLDSVGLKFKKEETLLQMRIAAAQMAALKTTSARATIDNAERLKTIESLKIQNTMRLAELQYHRRNSSAISNTVNELEEERRKSDAILDNIQLIRDGVIDTNSATGALKGSFNFLFGKTGLIVKDLGNLGKLIEGSASSAAFLTEILKVGYENFKSFDKAAASVRSNLGALPGQVNNLESLIKEVGIESMHLGVTFDDVAKYINEIANEFTGLVAQDTSLLKTTTALAKQFGIAEGTSVKFLKTLGGISGNSASSQKSMIGFAQKMAQASGVPLGKIMEDVANASDDVRIYVGSSAVSMIKAATAARMMGIDMNKAAATAEKLLNFESSIASELKASALLGQNVNFNYARRLAFNKDIIGANKEILKITKQVNFNQLNPIQQKAYADAAGKSVSELQDMLTQEKNIQLVRNGTNEKAKKALADYERMMQLKDEEAKNEGKVAEQQILQRANQEKLAQIQNKFNQLMSELAEPVMEVLDGFLTIATELLPYIKFALMPIVGVTMLFSKYIVGIGTQLATWGRAMSIFGTKFLSIGKVIGTVAKFAGSFIKIFGTKIPVIGQIISALLFIRNYIRDLKRMFEEGGTWGEMIVKGLLLIPKAIIEAFLPFDSIKKKLDEWFFGKSPSKAGKLIAKGFSSIGPELQDSLTAPINSAYKDIENMSPPEVSVDSKNTGKLNGIIDNTLIQTIQSGNQQMVAKIDQLISMMANGGIAVNLDGQLVSRQLSTTAYRSGGFGQSTTRS
jgi:hypothetical protein